MIELGMTLIACVTILVALQMIHEHERAEWKQDNVVRISETLEKKISEMDDLKQKMEMLLIRSGLGRIVG